VLIWYALYHVVQEPFKHLLQLILTEKIWGVRKLADIPKDSFVSTYFEEVCTKKDAKNDCVIKVVEDIKDEYKSYVVQSNYESKNYTFYSSSDDKEFNLSWEIQIKSKLSTYV